MSPEKLIYTTAVVLGFGLLSTFGLYLLNKEQIDLEQPLVPSVKTQTYKSTELTEEKTGSKPKPLVVTFK